MNRNTDRIMPDVEAIRRFLIEVDQTFPVPLSQKQELEKFAVKLYEKATFCTVMEKGRIIAMTAGYVENVVENLGYISVVATLPEYQGRGYSSDTVRRFIEKAKEQHLDGVHLYTASGNEKAIRMYKRIGFEELLLEHEERPKDVHLIYNIRT